LSEPNIWSHVSSSFSLALDRTGSAESLTNANTKPSLFVVT